MSQARSNVPNFDETDDPNGPLKTEGYVCPSKGSDFKLQTVILPSLTPTMIQADIQMIGLCHTDIHMRDNDWGISDFPLLAGHEAVAIVTVIGACVRTLKVGDRVALAWIRDSCRACDGCLAGRENICEDGYQGTYLGKSSGVWGNSPLAYNLHGGCFVRTQRMEERFAVKIPDSIPSEMVCPLLCGGGTVYEPLCDYSGPGVVVGIVGIGGLGTAAIKLAKLRGCIVYALSGTESKKEGALAAGADFFVWLSDKEQVKAIQCKMNLVLDTTPANLDIGPLLNLVKFGGTMCRVGIPPGSDQVFTDNTIPLVFTQRKVAGSVVIGTKRMKEMLDLIAANLDFVKDTDVWKTEELPISKLNEGMKNLLNRTNKGYRYVLKW